MSVNWHNLFFISVGPLQTESMCSFTPHFTQGGLALHPGANGGLNQVTALGGVLMGGMGYALPSSAASAVVGFKVTGEVHYLYRWSATSQSIICPMSVEWRTWWEKRRDWPPSCDSPNAFVMKKESCYSGGVILHLKCMSHKAQSGNLLCRKPKKT